MCKISLEHKSKDQIRPEVLVHSKPSECTNPAFTPKYEYVEVAKLIINADDFINNKYEFKMTPEISHSQPRSEQFEQTNSINVSK